MEKASFTHKIHTLESTYRDEVVPVLPLSSDLHRKTQPELKRSDSWPCRPSGTS